MSKFPDAILARFGDYLRDNPAWGSLHIVLDDHNTEDAHVEFCIEWAQDHDDPEGVALGWIVLGMSEHRRRALGLAVEQHIRWA